MNPELGERAHNLRSAIKKTHIEAYSRWAILLKESKNVNSFIELLDRRIILNIEKKNQRILGSGFLVGAVSFAASYNYILYGTHKAVRLGISLIYLAIPIKMGYKEFMKSWTLMRMLTTKYKHQINEYNLHPD